MINLKIVYIHLACTIKALKFGAKTFFNFNTFIQILSAICHLTHLGSNKVYLRQFYFRLQPTFY